MEDHYSRTAEPIWLIFIFCCVFNYQNKVCINIFFRKFTTFLYKIKASYLCTRLSRKVLNGF